MSEMEVNTEEKSKKKTTTKQFLAKWGGLLFLLIMIGAIVVLAVMKISIGQELADIVIDFSNKYPKWGIYLGVAVISVFGNFTVIFPIPYSVALIVIGAVVPGVNPILVGLAAGLGAGLGEVSAWLIGRGGQEFIKSEKTERMKRYIEKGWAPVLIFIFAATPLPDDALLIVVGYTGYSVFKTLIWCFLGKFVLCTFTTAIPVWIQYYWPQFAKFLYEKIFVIDYEDAVNGIVSTTPPDWTDIAISTSVWIGIIIVTFILISIDWDKVFHRVKKTRHIHPHRSLKKGVDFKPHEEDEEEPIPKDAQLTENEKK